MQKTLINFLFITLITTFFLFFSHISLLDGSTSALGLGSSNNLFTLAVASCIIALGFWSVAARKEITLNSSFKMLSLTAVLFTVPAIYHYAVHDNPSLTPAIGALFFGLTFFAYYQLYRVVNLKKLLILLIPAGAALELLLIHFNSDFSEHLSISANHVTGIVWGLTALIFVASSDCESGKIRKISNVVSAAIAVMLVLELSTCSSVLTISAVCLTTLISGIAILKQGQKTVFGFSLLVISILSVVITCSSCISSTTHNFTEYSMDTYAQIISPHLVIGTGYDTANSTILHYLVNNDLFLPFKTGISTVSKVIIGAGAVGFLAIFTALLWIYRNYFKFSPRNTHTVSSFCVIMPLLIFALYTDIFEESYLMVLLLVSYCWCYDVDYEDRTVFYQTKSNFLVGQLAWIIPLLTIIFSATGIASLPLIKQEINDKESTTPYRTPAYFNPLVGQIEYDELTTIKTTKTIHDSHILALIPESIDNLRDKEQFSINPKLYGILSKLEKLYSTNPNLPEEQRNDLSNQSAVHEKIQQFLEAK
ncbi:hypothetical protein [Ruminobacter sp.]|uniref:hypothetical protein n=1 Tax=Ruminobacter sp. TaxID=2774296 RepID=UPI00386F5624